MTIDPGRLRRLCEEATELLKPTSIPCPLTWEAAVTYASRIATLLDRIVPAVPYLLTEVERLRDELSTTPPQETSDV